MKNGRIKKASIAALLCLFVLPALAFALPGGSGNGNEVPEIPMGLFAYFGILLGGVVFVIRRFGK